MKKIPFLSIISPVYKAEEIVNELVKRIKEEVSLITEDFEIILIEDGSPDQSWNKIEENCKLDNRVKGIKLSRNFGQHYAISAGLKESRGDYVVLMDCDLQDNPKYIPEMLQKSKEGNFDIIFTLHSDRKHKVLKNIFANLFHIFYNWLVGNKSLENNGKIGTYSLLTRKVVEAFCEFNDYHRHYLSVIRWLGFSKGFIEIEHEERFSGKTSYTFFKLVVLAVDGIVSQTKKLLLLSVFSGFIMAFIGVISIIYIVMKSITEGFQPGWASTMVLIIFSTGIILISLGIVGIYVGKIFDQVKERPLYIIDKRINI